MQPSTIEVVATVLFGVAVLHTFLVKRFEVMAHRRPPGMGRNLLELLGEVEVVFGFWAGVLIVVTHFIEGHGAVTEWLNGRKPGVKIDFTEPMFVFAIMSVAATRPIIEFATSLVRWFARFVPAQQNVAVFVVTLVVGPLLGALITGPAAMTVTALLLKKRFFDAGLSAKLAYGTVGVLFVNVSVGGSLTNFAAPPVLMVARTWDWDSLFMLGHFGWKAAIAVTINAVALTALFRPEITRLDPPEASDDRVATPKRLKIIHIAVLGLLVFNAHEVVIFMGVFLLFLGIVEVTEDHQDPLKLRQALLVAFFLGGLVVLGSYQSWWLQPLLSQMDAEVLFPAATAMTAVTDNAALTYLGSLVPTLGAADKYALVAGALAGGGLTVIANAPNPAGYGILKSSFGPDGISPLGLLAGAIAPTIVVLGAFAVLPHL